VTDTAQGARPARAPRGPAPWPHTGTFSFANLSSRFSILLVWAALIIVYSLTETQNFARTGTYQTIFGSQEGLVFMTMALMCTIVVGELVDLLVPAVFGFAATIMPVLNVTHGWGAWPSSLVAVLAAVAVGAVQGFLLRRAREQGHRRPAGRLLLRPGPGPRFRLPPVGHPARPPYAVRRREP
jgi:ribose transport system permease protein